MWRSSMIMALLLTAFVMVSGIGGMYMYAKMEKDWYSFLLRGMTKSL